MHYSLIYEFVKRDLRDRYSGSALGIFWNFLVPLSNILIFILIFSKLMGAKLQNLNSEYGYSIYLISGILPWMAFSSTISRITNVFIEKSYIIKKISINLSTLPLYILLSESVIFFISFTIFVIFLLLIDHSLNKYYILLPIIFLLHQIFAYSFGILCATINVFLRDLREIVNIMIQVWFWFTPIVYVSEILPEKIKKIILLNPAFYFVDCYHNIIVFNKIPDKNYLLILLITGHILGLFSYLLFKKLEKDIRDFV